MEISLIKTATILRAHEYLIKSTKAFHRIVREISTFYGEWNLNLKPIKGGFLLTLCNHVSFRNFGFESILHSKYTSSPSLMSPAWSFDPSSNEITGGSRHRVRFKLIMSKFTRLTFSSQKTLMFQLSSTNMPATLGFSAWHVNILPLSSIDGTKLRIDVVSLFLEKSRIRLSDFLPLNHVMMASGREPDVTQWISYFRSATSVNELLTIFTEIGLTAFMKEWVSERQKQFNQLFNKFI